jgi:hypothetical protein
MFSLVTGLPSTTSAARISPALFGGFAGTMPLFDSSPACLPGLRFWLPGPVRGLVGPRMPTRSLGSRACSFSTCVRLLDYAGPGVNSRCRFRQCGLPVACTRSAPGIRFSKLDSSPVVASVYTSPGPSRHPAQDLRSRWFATPFLWGSFIPDCTPVYPDACVAVGMAVTSHPPHRPVLAGTTAYGSYLGWDSLRNLASKRAAG